MPELSVIIVNWNGRHFLNDCLSSLRQQTFRDFEVILVDNASEDGSVDYVHQFFPEVRVITEPVNLGFAAGNWAGYKEARGEVIALLNNDTATDPSWLSELHQALHTFPQAGSAASKMLYFDDRKRIDNCGFWLASNGTTVELGRDELDGPQSAEFRWVFGACAGAAAYRRTMLEDIGFLDPDFFMIYEDVDLSFRAQLRGYPCLFVPTAIVYHHLGATLKRVPAQRVFWSQRNIEYVYVKNMPASMMLRSLPQRLVYELGGAIYFTLQGRGASFLRAKLAAFRNLPELLRKRKTILGSRSIADSQLRTLTQRDWFTPKWRRFVSVCNRAPTSQVVARTTGSNSQCP
jgi:GT2 family glycosyltransferase